MPNLMIACAVTGDLTSTGWFIDPDEFSRLEDSTQSVHCDRCHESHSWSLGDAVWETY